MSKITKCKRCGKVKECHHIVLSDYSNNCGWIEDEMLCEECEEAVAKFMSEPIVLSCPYCHHPLDSHVQATESHSEGGSCTEEGCNCEIKPKADIPDYGRD